METRDQDKTKAQLLIELAQAREQIAALEEAQEEFRRSGQRALELAINEVKSAALRSFLGNLTGFVNTPLTLLKASLLALRNIPAEDVQQEQWQVLEAQIGYLERLFENMLLMVRLDNLVDLDLSSLNLSCLVQQVVDRLKPLADEREHIPMFRPQADGPRVRRIIFCSRALTAIVTNALDFTPPGGRSWWRRTRRTRPKRWWKCVTTDGTIPMICRVFKRFWWRTGPITRIRAASGWGWRWRRRPLNCTTGASKWRAPATKAARFG
jgi:two-component system sensor histidine kinase CreC